jgi:hypothetical protein
MNVTASSRPDAPQAERLCRQRDGSVSIEPDNTLQLSAVGNVIAVIEQEPMPPLAPNGRNGENRLLR